MKRFTWLLIVLALCLILPTAFGEGRIAEQKISLRSAHDPTAPSVSGPLNVVTGEEYTYHIVNGQPGWLWQATLYERGDAAPGGGYYMVNPVNLTVINETITITFEEEKTYILFASYQESASGSLHELETQLWIDATSPSGELNMKIQEIVAQCRAEVSGEWETALWLHDWLINHAYYDLTYSEYGADGVLLKGYGVCDSYSKAYQMLLNEFGIQNHRQTGTAGGENHAWNVVKLDGVWCMIDPTWDDPAGESVPVSGNEQHRYFGMTDSMLGEDHDYTITYPCTSLDNYYLVRMGLPAVYHRYADYGYRSFTESEAGLLWQAKQGMDPITADVSKGYCTKWQDNGNGGVTLSESTADMDLVFTIMATEKSARPMIGPDDTEVWYAFTYDPDAKTLTGVITNPKFAVTVDERIENGTVAADKAAAAEGETVTLTVTPAAGYRLKSLTVTGADDVEVTVADYQFTMPASAVTVTAAFEAVQYSVTVDEGIRNGAVASDKAAAVMNETVTLTVTPADGFRLKTLTATGEGGLAVPVTNGQFTMPAADVLVTAEFEYDVPTYAEAFSGNVFTLPGSLTTIEAEAFAGNRSIAALFVPDSVTAIGDAAFADCTNLAAVRLPKNVTLEGQVFTGSAQVVIYAAPGGTAEAFAETNAIPFVPLGE